MFPAWEPTGADWRPYPWKKKKRITENLVYIVTTYVVDPCLGRTNRKYRRLYIFNILSLCLLLYYYQLVCIIIYWPNLPADWSPSIPCRPIHNCVLHNASIFALSAPLSSGTMSTVQMQVHDWTALQLKSLLLFLGWDRCWGFSASPLDVFDFFWETCRTGSIFHLSLSLTFCHSLAVVEWGPQVLNPLQINLKFLLCCQFYIVSGWGTQSSIMRLEKQLFCTIVGVASNLSSYIRNVTGGKVFET